MAGYNNIDQAVVLPKSDYPQIEERMYQRQQQRKAEEEMKAARAQQRQDTLVGMVGREFEDKDYMTGTAADPFINQKLSDVRKKYSAMILNNPNISHAELLFGMQKDVGDIASTSSAFKAANSSIADLTKDFDKTKGIDGGAIRKLAFNNILYTSDPKTGQKRLRTAEELNAVVPAEEVDKIIKQHPEVYLDEATAMQSKLKSYQPWQTGNQFETEHAGVKKTLAYDANLLPFQQILRDKNGREILDANGKAQYGLRSKPAEIDGQPLTIGGKPIQVMDDDVYQDWVSDRATKAILISDLNAFNRKSGKPPIEEGTPEGDILMNSFLYNRLKDVKPPKFETKDLTTKAAFLDKREAGVTNEGVARSVTAAVEKLNRDAEKAKNNDVGTILGGAALQSGVISGANKEVVNGKSMLNITGTVGDLKLGYKTDPTTKERKPILGEIFVDPENPGGFSIRKNDGTVTAYRGKELEKVFKSIAGYNGWSVSMVDNALKQFVDADGNFKAIDREAKRQLGGETREANNAINKFKTEAKKVIETIPVSGVTQDLKTTFEGKQGVIDDQPATIKSIELEPGWFTDTAIVTYIKPDNTEETINIKRPQSSGKLKEFLENFIK